MKSIQKPLVILSAGGTGGHVIPAQALAHELIERDFHVEVITDSRGLKYTNGFGGIPIHEVSAGTSIKGALKLIIGVVQSMGILLKKKPAVVVGFGGYPSFPGVVAAQLLARQTILHESNAIFGKANKALGFLATRISLSWENSRGLSNKEQAKSVLTGNPIRKDIAELSEQPYPAIKDKLNILVMGGSLGATVFSEVLPKAFAELSDANKARLSITQQCREADIEGVREVYKASGVNAELMTFVEDVPNELAKCHLFIGRSGGTVFEITAAGRPALYVPYPHHADQQQKINADAISDKGGSWTIEEKDFTPELVQEKIETFLSYPEILSNAAAKAKACGTPDAAAKLASLVETLTNAKG